MKPTKITQQELIEDGWMKRDIYGIETMPEYSKPYAPDSTYEPPRWRIVVRFNEIMDELESGRAYLYLANSILPLFSIETLDDLNTLHRLLSFDKWELVP